MTGRRLEETATVVVVMGGLEEDEEGVLRLGCVSLARLFLLFWREEGVREEEEGEESSESSSRDSISDEEARRSSSAS